MAARKGEALAELGARTGTAVSHGVFLLVAPKRTLQSTLPLLTQVFDAYFNQRFLREPRRAISVYLFPSARTYSAYCRARWQTECTSIYGFYLGSERRIVMNIELGVGTLTHELVHPIMQTDFPESPMWFEEGVASLYERFGLLKRGEIRGYTNWRLNGLRQGLKHNPNHASLTHLFGLSDVEFRDDEESLHYAAARYFCQWLEEQGKLWPFYRKWQSSAGDDPTGQRSFESVMGMTPAEANGVWIRWVNQL